MLPSVSKSSFFLIHVTVNRARLRYVQTTDSLFVSTCVATLVLQSGETSVGYLNVNAGTSVVFQKVIELLKVQISMGELWYMCKTKWQRGGESQTWPAKLYLCDKMRLMITLEFSRSLNSQSLWVKTNVLLHKKNFTIKNVEFSNWNVFSQIKLRNSFERILFWLCDLTHTHT